MDDQRRRKGIFDPFLDAQKELVGEVDKTEQFAYALSAVQQRSTTENVRYIFLRGVQVSQQLRTVMKKEWIPNAKSRSF